MIAGIDIGGTKIAVGLVNDDGSVVAVERIPVHPELGPASASVRIQEALRGMMQLTAAPLDGIGIACTGPVDPISGELSDVNTLRGWTGWNPVKELGTAFGVRSAMENDADAAALGEARWGVGRGRNSLVSVTVGTGIGVGIVLGGQLLRGAGGSHPEIGHHVIDPSGPLCTCGIHGCWESLASGPSLEQWYAEQNPGQGCKSGGEICALARAGDEPAQIAVARLRRFLGIGISNVVSIFVPDVVALSGSVMQSADLLLDGIRACVRVNCTLVPADQCEILISSLGNNAGVIGAAQVWHSRVHA